MKVSGTIIGILEILSFYIISYNVKLYNPKLQTINTISYYWLMFTILTGIWEYTFVLYRKPIRRIAFKFIHKKEHVWSNKYSLKLLIPWNLSRQFYAEYGAYADREYMSIKDSWSRLIEGTHSLICGVFAFLSIYYLSINNQSYYITISISMASQLMNSILYMGEYFIQIKDKHSVNLNTPKFPCGFALIKRPFMYVNLFWTIMPCYVLSSFLHN
mgnify:CR=1 FL=1|jgi:hypothetical protein